MSQKLGALCLSPSPSPDFNRAKLYLHTGKHYKITMECASQRGALGFCQARGQRGQQ